MSERKITEADVKRALKKRLNGRSDTRIYSNPSGVVMTERGTPLKFGCGDKEPPDFLGFHRVLITPAMVGKRLAVFLAIEAKGKGGKKTTKKERLKGQQQWLDVVTWFGGIAFFAESADEAEERINAWLQELNRNGELISDEERKGSGPGRVDIPGGRRRRNSRTGF